MFTSDVYIYDGVKLELHGESGTTVSVVPWRWYRQRADESR